MSSIRIASEQLDFKMLKKIQTARKKCPSKNSKIPKLVILCSTLLVVFFVTGILGKWLVWCPLLSLLTTGECRLPQT